MPAPLLLVGVFYDHEKKSGMAVNDSVGKMGPRVHHTSKPSVHAHSPGGRI